MDKTFPGAPVREKKRKSAGETLKRGGDKPRRIQENLLRASNDGFCSRRACDGVKVTEVEEKTVEPKEN